MYDIITVDSSCSEAIMPLNLANTFSSAHSRDERGVAACVASAACVAFAAAWLACAAWALVAFAAAWLVSETQAAEGQDQRASRSKLIALGFETPSHRRRCRL